MSLSQGFEFFKYHRLYIKYKKYILNKIMSIFSFFFLFPSENNIMVILVFPIHFSIPSKNWEPFPFDKIKNCNLFTL